MYGGAFALHPSLPQENAENAEVQASDVELSPASRPEKQLSIQRPQPPQMMRLSKAPTLHKSMTSKPSQIRLRGSLRELSKVSGVHS